MLSFPYLNHLTGFTGLVDLLWNVIMRKNKLASLHTFARTCSHLHGHVLQRAVRQIRHAAAVRLLPVLGPQLGVPEERHHGGNHQL